MPQDSTTRDSTLCTCDICVFIRLMDGRLPELPKDPEAMANALSVLLLSPEVREAFKRVLRQFDGMGRPGRKQLSEMDVTEFSLATILLNSESRNALKSMVRAADRGDV